LSATDFDAVMTSIMSTAPPVFPASQIDEIRERLLNPVNEQQRSHGPQEAYEKCPWCGFVGAPYETQRECRAFFKGDSDLRCGDCYHEHHPTDPAKCLGEDFGGYAMAEVCGCKVFVEQKSPCEIFLSNPSRGVSESESSVRLHAIVEEGTQSDRQLH
jgi:hypothetical protein